MMGFAPRLAVFCPDPRSQVQRHNTSTRSSLYLSCMAVLQAVARKSTRQAKLANQQEWGSGGQVAAIRQLGSPDQQHSLITLLNSLCCTAR